MLSTGLKFMRAALILYCFVLADADYADEMDINCSKDVIPDLNGAWVCDDDWLLNTEPRGDDIDGAQKWLLYFDLPKFYAVSKIQAIPTCKRGDSLPLYILRLTTSVWDESLDREDGVRLPEEPEEKWLDLEIQNMDFNDDGSQEYSGFSYRAPYWRLELETKDMGMNCLPKFKFFARAGVAAMGEYVMAIDIPELPQDADISYQAAPVTNNCDKVTRVPSSVTSYYRLDTSFYRKYTSAYGIPILSSNVVDDKAMQRACYVVRFMLADREDLRSHMLKNKGRVAIIGRRETVPMVPEMRQYYWWTRRAAGGTYHNPVNVGAEENMLCERADGYAPAQDIFMHEFAHGVHLIACHTAIRGFNSRLQRSFEYARSRGLWRNTYANTDNREYFAEGVQAYFNQQREGPVGGDGIQNHIDTREELRGHDPTLYKIIDELFPCDNKYIPRCNDRSQDQGIRQNLRLNCNGGTVITTTKTTSTNTTSTGSSPPTPTPTPTAGPCEDKSRYCSYWARNGECEKNPEYMKTSCRMSCKECSSGCADADKSCRYWSSYCSTNNYVIKNCKKTCKKC